MVVGDLRVIFGPGGGSRSSVGYRDGSAVNGDPPGTWVAVVARGIQLRDFQFRVQPRILHTVGTVVIFFPGEGSQLQKVLEGLADVVRVFVSPKDVLDKQVRHFIEADDVFPSRVDLPQQTYPVVKGVVVIADVQGWLVLYGRTAATSAAGRSWSHGQSFLGLHQVQHQHCYEKEVKFAWGHVPNQSQWFSLQSFSITSIQGTCDAGCQIINTGIQQFPCLFFEIYPQIPQTCITILQGSPSRHHFKKTSTEGKGF